MLGSIKRRNFWGISSWINHALESLGISFDRLLVIPVLNALLQTEALVQLKFEDLQRDGEMVCVVSAAAASFRLRYPDMVQQVIEVNGAADALDLIGTKCKAAVVMHDAWERFSNTHCDLMSGAASSAVM